MKSSLRALLTSVIDYAGLFPPASLSLDESIRNYAKYQTDHDAWMLGRFICPTKQLADLSKSVRELFATGAPLEIIALGRGGKTVDEFRLAMEADKVDMQAFESLTNGRAKLGGFECKSPSELPGFSAKNVFLESEKVVPTTGFKLRTGGVEASAFPPPEKIAHAFMACRELNRPMKFTAGMHHPIRHFNESVNTKMHGFINVFVAGALMHAHGLAESTLVSILSDEDAASFSFDDDGLQWRDQFGTIPQIETARREFVISFGSCSFDEPREDLRALGWL